MESGQSVTFFWQDFVLLQQAINRTLFVSRRQGPDLRDAGRVRAAVGFDEKNQSACE